MIQLTSAATLQNAITKARTVKPFVCINCFGLYDVTNKQTGARYNVVCLKREGKRFAHCTSKAGARGQACYHALAAVSAHIQLASERAALDF